MGAVTRRRLTRQEAAGKLAQAAMPDGVTNNGTSTGGSERQRRLRQRRERSGLLQLTLWVPAGAAADLRELAELLRAHPHLVAGPARDPVSGKLVSIRRKSPGRT